MGPLVAAAFLVAIVAMYFKHNPLGHAPEFLWRRFVTWFPLGMSYAFLYMARYNLNVCKNELGESMTKENFGVIFGVGTLVYGVSFLVNGPIVDSIGGKRGMVIGATGAALANVGLGLATYLFVTGRVTFAVTPVFAVLYGLNMFFQSYGAVSINKVKAYWFHVRERGFFGGIFGTLISFGSYFAFDWSASVLDFGRAHPQSGQSASWLVFFVPAAILLAWAALDWLLISDLPSEAGFADFDTADASSGEMDRDLSLRELFGRIFGSRLMLTFAAIEFTAGVVRNGVMQWYFIFAHELPQGASDFFLNNWGLLICLLGILGGFCGGWCSDRLFQSRRGPPVAVAQAVICAAATVMAFTLFKSPVTVGVCCLLMFGAVITVHSLMSATAGADFGGRKATATATGILDGFVYLGSGLQSLCLGYLTTRSWVAWPIFLIPFAVIGLYLSLRIWRELPDATRRYLAKNEPGARSLGAGETMLQGVR